MYRIGKEEAEAAARVIESGELFRVGSKRREVESFEQGFAQRLGVRHALLLSGGTGALAAALVAIGIGPGDEVIVPAYTFIATPIAVLMTGAVPVIAEVDETLTMDPADVRRKLSAHTRALLPVHIQGFPCDMAALEAIAKAHGLLMVEDACQAAGGSFRGRALGSIGDAAAFSFNAQKIITAGEGGAFVTNDDEYYKRALLYHDCGAAFWSKDAVAGTIPFAGSNLRASEITGAIMRVQLTRLDGILADLRRVKTAISRALTADPGFAGADLIPSHDAAGDCGTTLGLRLPEAEQAKKLAAAIGGACPLYTERHVYTHWDAILHKQGAGTPAQNPFLLPQNQGLQTDYAPDMCPRTLDYLGRSVYLPLHCDWDDRVIEEKVRLILQGLKSL